MLAALTLVSLLVAPEAGRVVTWNAPEQCPAADAVETAVAAYVGRPLGDEAVHATATVEPTADGFALTLTLRRGAESDVRSLTDPNCAVLADAAALMLAVAIDPDAAAEAIEHLDPLGTHPPALDAPDSEITTPPDSDPTIPPSPDPTQSDPGPPATPNAETDDPADNRADQHAPTSAESEPNKRTSQPRSRDERDRERPSCRPGPMGGARPSCVAIGASLPLQIGPLPRFGPGVGGHAALLWPRVRFELGGAFYFTQSKRLDSDATRGGDIRLGVGHARACGRLGWRTLEFPLCGGVEAGAMHGQGVNLDNAQSDRIPWFAGLADAAFVYSPVRVIALRAQLGTVIPFATYRFRAKTLGTIHQATPLGLRLALSLDLRF